MLRKVAFFCIVSVFASLVHAAVTEQEISIPVTVKGLFGETQKTMYGTEFRPDGDGPFPLVVINHGTPTSSVDNGKVTDVYKAHARLFAALGFVVINPLRLGYGKSDGPVRDSYGSCNNPAYWEAGMMTGKDIDAAVEYARGKSYIDTSRIVLVGQSGGGFGVLALASENVPGVVGVINFAGGRGARGVEQVCNEAKLIDTYDRFAKTTHVPMLWFYSANDHSFYPDLARRMYGAYQNEKVDVRFIVAPPYKNDGHGFFHGIESAPVWMQEVKPFLRKLGFVIAGEGAVAVAEEK